MNRNNAFILTIALLLSLSACRTVSLTDAPPMQPPAGMTTAQIEAAIAAGVLRCNGSLAREGEGWSVQRGIASASVSRISGDASGWIIESSHPGLTVAGLSVRQHYLQVTYTYTPTVIRSAITGSENLKQSGDSIHRNALSWARRLNACIFQELRS